MYIFGYGSLLNSHSRKLTGQTGEAIPAVIHGLVRSWSLIDETYILSPLAVTTGQGEVNGLLLEVDEQGLKDFDIREAGYERIEVHANQIESTEKFDSSRPVWVYVTENASAPTVESPIVQSYVDTVIAGCLEVSEHFARHFIEHTRGWHHPLENDRHQPKYSRMAGVTTDDHPAIDLLIAERLAYPV